MKSCVLELAFFFDISQRENILKLSSRSQGVGEHSEIISRKKTMAYFAKHIMVLEHLKMF